MVALDLAGKKFGHLTVLRMHPERERGQHILWVCRCVCGKEIIVRGSKVKDGEIKSCGCMQHKYKHCQTNTRLYHIWCTMKARCLRKTAQKYAQYGGRGIRVCDEWANDFAKFYQWAMKNGYDDKLSIDRINNNGNYCPENCRWATNMQQANNRSKNRIATFNGKTDTISNLARFYGFLPRQIFNRVDVLGWSLERALSTPIGATSRGG